MSSLKVSQIKARLRGMFEHHLDLSDISVGDNDRDSKILSRCLAALGVYLKSGCTEKEAAEAVWDGADDNGIDAAFYEPSESRVLLVQAKWIEKGAGEPSAAEIGTFVQGVRDLVEQEHMTFHPRLQGKLSDISLRLATPGNRVHLVVVSTGADILAPHGTHRIESFIKELNGSDPDPIASSETIGLQAVYSGLASDPQQGNVSLDANILEWAYIPSPIPAYFGVIDGLQLKQWWTKHGKRVVSANIRHSLGATDVNAEIKSTAQNYPERFWYFNNGVTLVADSASKAPAGAASRSAGLFEFKAASIVNGAQTVSSLAKVDDDKQLGITRIPIRVILLATAPVGFGAEVTRTNNLQNRIEPRDFVVQDPEQKRLREEMAIEGVDYQVVRSEDTAATATTCELLEVTTALACASGDASLATQLKTGIGRFFVDLGKAPYKSIFNPLLSGARAFNSVAVQRRIDAWIENEKRTLSKKSGPAWGVLVHGNRILAAAVFKLFGLSKLAQPISAFPAEIPGGAIEQHCHDVHKKMVTALQGHYPGKFLAVLFKNPTMSKHVFDAAVA